VLLDQGLDLLELNPVVVHRDGCVALDAVGRRATRREGAAARREARLTL